MVKIFLVIARDCPFSPEAKKVWERLKERLNFELEVIDAFTPEGRDFVMKNKILAVPVALMEKEGELKIIAKGIPKEDEVEKLIKEEGK